MSEGASNHQRREPTPVHLWLMGLLLVLWNGWGVALAIGTQTDRLPVADPEMSAFFEAQPLWLILFADIGPLAGVAGAVALLLQSRWATWLFLVQIVVLALSNSYEVVVETSLLLTSAEARAGMAVLAVVLCGQVAYARMMTRRGVLY